MERINKDTLKRSFLYTFILGFLAHGYGFLHFQPSHDSLVEAVSNGSYWKWKIQLGRYLKPLYDFFLGRFTSFPWVNGIVALIWLSLAVYLVAEMLEMRKKSHIAIISGILTTNVTVTATAATYTPDLGSNMLALALAMLGAYIWKECSDHGPFLKKSTVAICGMAIGVCIAASLALYQTFVFSFVTMVLVVSVLRCLQNPEYPLKKLWISDFLAAGAAIIGGILYYIGLKMVTSVTGVSIAQDDYNSLSNAWSSTESIKDRVADCWEMFKTAFAEMPGYVYPSQLPRLINLLLLLVVSVCLVGSVIRLSKKKHPAARILSLVAFAALLPFSMNGVRLLNPFVHVLMVYSYWLAYVFVFCVAVTFVESRKSKWMERLTAALLCGILLINIQTANASYVKKTMEQETTLSLMTRVIDRVESLEGYEAGYTPVLFVGMPYNYLNSFAPFDEIETLTGLMGSTAITYPRGYSQYFQMIMRVNVNVVDNVTDYGMDAEAVCKDMPNFPAKDSVQMKNGVVIVKFADWS